MSISLVFVASQLLLEIEVIQRREAVCRKNEDIWKPINLLLKELGNIWRDTGCIAILVRYIASRPVLFKNVTKFDLHWGKINGDPSESNVLWGSIKRAAEPSFRSILLSIDSYCSASTSWRSRSDLSFVMQLYWSAWSCFMTISLSSDKDRPKFFFFVFLIILYRCLWNPKLTHLNDWHGIARNRILSSSEEEQLGWHGANIISNPEEHDLPSNEHLSFWCNRPLGRNSTESESCYTLKRHNGITCLHRIARIS